MKILLVCTGNTCRSCMAEGLLTDMLKNISKDSEITVQSAGIFAMPNQTASENALVAMKNQSIDLSYHKSKQLTIDMIQESDLVLTMTNGHKQSILQSLPEASEKVYTLKEYVGLGGDIQDPFGGSLVVYEESLRDIKESLELLIEKL